MPSITNDSPPMNEIVLDGVNGVCVDSVRWGEAGSGIPAFDPDFDQLTAAIERLGDAGERERLAAGRDRAARGRAQLAAHGRRPRRSCSAADARRDRHEVVQPRPAGGRPPAALGARRARPRDLRARAAEEGARPAARGARPRRRLGPARASPRRRAYDVPRGRVRGLGRRERDRGRPLRPELPVRRARASCAPAGCATIGRFVWEHFTAEHVAGAREAFDVVYSLTRAEQERYRGDGPRDALRALGLPPGADRGTRASRRARAASAVTFVFPGGFLGHRKPLEPVLEAFDGDRRPAPAAARQGAGRAQAACAPPPRPPSATRGSSCASPTSRPPSTCARSRAADVCLAPARWEGLGLPLYEAIAFGQPAITNDAPPMNEAIHDGATACSSARRPTGPRSRGSRRSTPTSTSCGARSSASPTTRCAPSSPRARCACATRERRWDGHGGGHRRAFDNAANG